jgi:CO/xanthine dehydrogenase FAD-binding subunit
MWKEYVCASSIEQALGLLASYGSRARIVAGATDLILEIERGVRKDVDLWIDITRIPDLAKIYEDQEGVIHLGPMVTHNEVVASDLIVKRAFPLAQAAWEVGAPQIRNRGTIVGNLITASPANDTITPLIALQASVVLASQRGRREVALKNFFLGVRKTVMDPDEFMLEIKFPSLSPRARGAYLKIGLRRAQAISVVNTAVVVELDGAYIQNAWVTLGSVAPTIIRSVESERILQGGVFSTGRINEAAQAAMESCSPITDVRGSASYRREMVRVAVRRTLETLAEGSEAQGFPGSPVLLKKPVAVNPVYERFTDMPSQNPIITHINGKEYKFNSGFRKTLLNLLRDEAGLIGTKRRLCRRRMWSLYGHNGWDGSHELPCACASGAWRGDHYHRRPEKWQSASSHPTSFH